MHTKDMIAKSCTKDTFWCNKRIEKKVTLKAMSADLGIDKTTLCSYLTGARLPATSISIKICDYFGVDYVTGAEEFNKAHELWVSSNPGKKGKRSHIRKRKFDTTKVATTVDVSEIEGELQVEPDLASFSTPDQTTVPETDNKSFIEMIYNKVSYEVFMSFIKGQSSVEDALRDAYNRLIPYDSFYALLKSAGMVR